MAVAFDAVGPSGGGGAGSSNPTSPLTWSHTCTGTNRVLYVGVVIGDRNNDADQAITGVTYNSVALTKIGSTIHTGANHFGFIELWRLINPDTGSNTVSVSWTNSSPDVLDSIEAGSVSFTGVHQTTPEVSAHTTNNTGSGSSFSLSVTSSTGNAVLDVAGWGTDFNHSTPSTQTTRWNLNLGGSTGASNGIQSSADGAASVSMGHSSEGGSDIWATIGIDIAIASDITVNASGNSATASITSVAVTTGAGGAGVNYYYQPNLGGVKQLGISDILDASTGII